ncbi:hypothetical protein ACTFIR_007539 [Dictyostelium discoideum]
MKLLVPKEKKKSVIKEIRNLLKLDCCSSRKLAEFQGNLMVLKDSVIPLWLYTSLTNKFHSQCLTLSNGDRDQSFPVHQDVKSEISHWLTVLNQWNEKEISLFPNNQNLVIPVVNNSIEDVIKSSRKGPVIKYKGYISGLLILELTSL